MIAQQYKRVSRAQKRLLDDDLYGIPSTVATVVLRVLRVDSDRIWVVGVSA